MIRDLHQFTTLWYTFQVNASRTEETLTLKYEIEGKQAVCSYTLKKTEK